MRWTCGAVAMALVAVACSGGERAPGEHAAPLPPAAPGSTALPSVPPAATAMLDEALCAKLDAKLAQDVMGKPVSKSFGVVEDTASGKRLRCEWQAGIRSLRASLYPDPEFWRVVVAGDDVSTYPNPFPAWEGDARANAFGFAYRLASGGTVDLAMAGGKPNEAALVGLARAIRSLVQPE